MKFLILILFLLSFNAIAANVVYNPKIIDGDTFETNVKPFAKLSPIKARIVGIDTPEIRGDCQIERELAQKAKDRLTELTKNKRVTYDAVYWDKYGGRVNVIAFVGGKDIGKQLIQEGLARPYDGGKKGGWCGQ